MANRIVSVHAGIYVMGIYAIMLPSSGFSVAHCASYMTHIYLYNTQTIDIILYKLSDVSEEGPFCDYSNII